MSLQSQLKELFHVDMQVRGLQSRLNAATRRRDAQQRKLEQLNQQDQELADHTRRTKAKQADLEHQAQQSQEKIDRHREQMNTVTSNKQYSAMLVEVNSLKNEKNKLEEQALELLDEIEASQQKQSEIQQKQSEQQKLVEQAERDVEAAQEEVGGRLEELTSERDEAFNALTPEARQLFQRLADAYEGEALAQVEEEDRRRMEYCCGGCFISLPKNHVNAVMTHPDQVTTCPNCGRILYVDQELQAAMKPKT